MWNDDFRLRICDCRAAAVINRVLPMNESGIGSRHSHLLPPLVVLSGPSGAGKSTVVDRLLAGCRFPLRRVVTATTRDPRPGEVDGRDYHFWSPDRFRQAVAAGEMLEHAVVFGSHSYGTPRAEVDPHRKRGTGVLLVIDVQGAAQVRAAYPDDHTSIFLDVPSLAELEQRLRSRGTEDEGRIARRLEAAARETARAGEFDHRVVNDALPDAVRQLDRIIADRFLRTGFQPCSTS